MISYCLIPPNGLIMRSIALTQITGSPWSRIEGPQRSFKICLQRGTTSGFNLFRNVIQNGLDVVGDGIQPIHSDRGSGDFGDEVSSNHRGSWLGQ